MAFKLVEELNYAPAKPPNWGPIKYEQEVEYVKVSKQNSYYKFIRAEMGDLEPSIIYRIQNPYLWACYQLKKEECESRYGYDEVEEYELWHATAQTNVGSIACGNFDWRRTVRSKFGQGVSFSDNPDYANTYCNYDSGDQRAMFLAKVIVSNECYGKYGMNVPSKHFDTSVGNNGRVYVKYSDNEFYPTYVAYYDDYTSSSDDGSSEYEDESDSY